MAVEIIDGCDHAGISFVERGQIETLASTDDVVTKGDQEQYSLGEGPCLSSIRDEETVSSPHLPGDQRWPRWAPWVSDQFGVQSMLCLQLFTSDQSYGALNLYSDTEAAFDEHDQTVGLALAAHAAVAISATKEIEGLNKALGTRTVIGQAQGILIERYQLSQARAFQVLVRYSRDRNERLVSIAEELLRSGNLPTD